MTARAPRVSPNVALDQFQTWRDVLLESVMPSKANISETLLMNLDF